MVLKDKRYGDDGKPVATEHTMKLRGKSRRPPHVLENLSRDCALKATVREWQRHSVAHYIGRSGVASEIGPNVRVRGREQVAIRIVAGAHDKHGSDIIEREGTQRAAHEHVAHRREEPVQATAQGRHAVD